MGIENDNKIGYQQIYKGFWKCRDFELAHFWQRAIFLSAFLLSCYAGYGSIVAQCATAEKVRLPFALINVMLTSVCIIGLILSCLWIMMAKGSKAWYEHYEAAINAFVDRYEKDGAFEGDLSQIAGFRIGNIEDFKGADISSWLWSAKAGSFSVSKINIAIGHLSFFIWGGLIMLHVSIAQQEFNTFREACDYLCSLITPMNLLSAVVSAILLFWIYSKMTLKSSYFDNK